MATSNPRTKRQIEGDLDDIRSRLVGSIEGLIDQVHPKRVQQRTVAQAKQFVAGEVASAKSLVYTPRGDLRTGRLAAVGGVLAAVVTLLVGLRTLVARRRRAASSPPAPPERGDSSRRRSSSRRGKS